MKRFLLLAALAACYEHPSRPVLGYENNDSVCGDGIDNDHDGYVDDVTGYDFVRNDGTPDDENGHGTATNGIIADSPFTFNGATYQGLAQGAKVINLKVLDQLGPDTSTSRAASRRPSSGSRP